MRQGATVKELKRVVALQVARREGSGINWYVLPLRPHAHERTADTTAWARGADRTYIWRRYALTSGPVKLEPDDARVHDFGVRSGSELGFVRRLHERKHGRRRAAIPPTAQ